MTFQEKLELIFQEPTEPESYYYYKGNWVDGFEFLAMIKAKTITKADDLFKEQFKIDPRKGTMISVFLAPLGDHLLNKQD